MQSRSPRLHFLQRFRRPPGPRGEQAAGRKPLHAFGPAPPILRLGPGARLLNTAEAILAWLGARLRDRLPGCAVIRRTAAQSKLASCETTKDTKVSARSQDSL